MYPLDARLKEKVTILFLFFVSGFTYTKGEIAKSCNDITLKSLTGFSLDTKACREIYLQPLLEARDAICAVFTFRPRR